MEYDYIKCGDALELIKSINDASIDLVVTDPPYRTISGGNAYTGRNGYPTSVLHKNDGKIFNYNNTEFSDWIPEVYRVLKPNSHFYCMTNLLNLKEIMSVCDSVGFKLHNLLVWEKNTANANRWYMKNCEFTLFYYKGTAKPINNCGSKQVHQFKNPVGNKCHPTEKPIELMEFYIANSCNVGDIVLDPFAGGGSTLVAAKNLNRHFIGFEIDDEYYNIIQNRLSNEVVPLNDSKRTKLI